MKHTRRKLPTQVSIVIVLLFIMSLACSAGDIDPKDSRLPGPINQLVYGSITFFTEVGQIVFGELQAPWILEPTRLYNAGQTVTLKGMAHYHIGSKVVIYLADPVHDFSKLYKSVDPLAEANVDISTNSWEVNITLPLERQFLAARLEQDNGEVSLFSNLIYISKSDPTPLVINSPLSDDIVFGDKITLEGKGDPGLQLEVWTNGEKTQSEVRVAPDSSWRVETVQVLAPAFDTKESITKNTIEVRCVATDQSATVELQMTEPISLIWPFGQGGSSNYKPDHKIGQVSSFFHDDWHYFGRNSKNIHTALDIASGLKQSEAFIHAVADGVISGFGSLSDGANYVIVDSGAWGTLYLHVQDKRPYSGLRLGEMVKAGDIIAIESNTGLKSTGKHLHISVRVWDNNSRKGSYSSFKLIYPSQQYNNSINKFINLNPPISSQKELNKFNIELYDWWGGSPYCEGDCWKGVKWSEIQFNQSKPDSTYATGCLKDGKWTGGYADSSYATRQFFCTFHPEECQCK
jgi:murein DD-endopeptidase MepM/ murein hydrolase activator NlpD